MQRFHKRKVPVMISFFTLIIGVVFTITIKVLAKNDSSKASMYRETQTIAQLSSAFSTSKIGTLHIPETIIISEVNGVVQFIFLSTGDEVKGGKQLLTISDTLGLYTLPLESSQSLLDSTQELYHETQNMFTQQLKKAE